MIQTKKFFLNGQEYNVDNNITIYDLIKYFKYNDSLLVLEYNNSICSKTSWHDTYIGDNDKIEIVTIVGGG